MNWQGNMGLRLRLKTNSNFVFRAVNFGKHIHRPKLSVVQQITGFGELVNFKRRQMPDYSSYREELRKLKEGQNGKKVKKDSLFIQRIPLNIIENEKDIIIKSRLLKESICLRLGHQSAENQEGGPVVYTAEEVLNLQAFFPEEIKQIHKIKKFFGGTVVEA